MICLLLCFAIRRLTHSKKIPSVKENKAVVFNVGVTFWHYNNISV